jgi:pimeloyl-ACP methyl ester carboxylesterase
MATRSSVYDLLDEDAGDEPVSSSTNGDSVEEPIGNPLPKVMGKGRDFSKLFEAFNLSPDQHTDHHYDHRLDADVASWDGFMEWRSRVGTGRVLTLPSKKAYGVPIDELIKKHSRVTNTFNIAYTVMMPKEWLQSSLNVKRPLIGLLHGVPTNRKWKYYVQKLLAQRGAIVVSFDMLGMGESSMVLDYTHRDQRTAEKGYTQEEEDEDANMAWDWKNDVDYVHELFMRHIPGLPQVNRLANKKFVLACDDWGAGIGEWYLTNHPDRLNQLFLLNPIHLDGYFVIEIGTIGKTAEVRRKMGNAAFQQGAFTLPQVMLGIEKYMIVDRKRMNRYTESSFMFPYQDVNYQAGKDAAHMKQHFWNLAVLADRASRLAPRQLQPYHRTLNPDGLKVTKPKDVPIDVIWGTQDQMMPPVQMFRTIYEFPHCPVAVHPIDGADHFVEVDQPLKVVNTMVAAMLRENKEAFPPFLGVGDDYVYKGDEKEMVEKLADIYVGAPRV